MRVVIQRVSSATVRVGDRVTGSIGMGLLILLGVEEGDSASDGEWLAGKICQMRIFSDEAGKMNRDLIQSGGQLLVVSQFTLHASARKGNRPSFIRAAQPTVAIQLYEEFVRCCEVLTGGPVHTGEFGAMMQVELVNDGPVTILLDSRREL